MTMRASPETLKNWKDNSQK